MTACCRERGHPTARQSVLQARWAVRLYVSTLKDKAHGLRALALMAGCRVPALPALDALSSVEPEEASDSGEQAVVRVFFAAGGGGRGEEAGAALVDGAAEGLDEVGVGLEEVAH